MKASHSMANWRLGVLMPLWVVELLAFVFAVVMIAIQSVWDGGVIAEFCFFLVAICLTVAEIIAYSSDKLGVWLFFGYQMFKAFFWTVFLIISIIGLVELQAIENTYEEDVPHYDTKYLDGAEVALCVYLAVVSVVVYWALAYSCIVVHYYRRTRQSGKYAPVVPQGSMA